jgi:hypothetical protein
VSRGDSNDILCSDNWLSEKCWLFSINSRDYSACGIIRLKGDIGMKSEIILNNLVETEIAQRQRG